MTTDKYLAIGDIHGCLKSLEALMDQLTSYDDRQYVFVGDYIDRGPDSKGVVDYLMDLRKKKDCIFIRGNHEQMLLDAVENDAPDLWMMNGGRTTLQSYGTDIGSMEIPKDHMEFYRETRLYYDTDNYFFVHAGLSPARTVRQSIEEEKYHKDFLWERSHLNAKETAWEKDVVFGHTPRNQPIQKGHKIGIDTGCVYKSLGYGTLTAVLLPEEEFIQQPCLDGQ